MSRTPSKFKVTLWNTQNLIVEATSASEAERIVNRRTTLTQREQEGYKVQTVFPASSEDIAAYGQNEILNGRSRYSSLQVEQMLSRVHNLQFIRIMRWVPPEEQIEGVWIVRGRLRMAPGSNFWGPPQDIAVTDAKLDGYYNDFMDQRETVSPGS